MDATNTYQKPEVQEQSKSRDDQVKDIRAVFEELGAAVASDRSALPRGRKAGGPLVNHLTRSEILLNAMAVFADKGVEATTVQDILTAAEISRRTFYKYFDNKVDVLENIYKMAVGLLMGRYRAVMAISTSASALLEAVVELYFDYHVSVGPIIRMMQEEALTSESPLAEHRKSAQTEMVAMLDQQMRDVHGKSMDPLVYHSLIWAMESASLHMLNETDCLPEEVAHAKKVMRGFASSVLNSAIPVDAV